MSARLCQGQLHGLPPEVAVPRYDRAALRAGIVHLGVGAFHRAHQAWYTEQALNRAGDEWGIIGASLRSPKIRDQLQAQDGLFTVVARHGEGCSYQVVGAIQTVLVGPENPDALVAQLSHPDIRLVTLTITEKGYLHDATTGGLQLDHPDVCQDIACFPESPRSAIAYLVAAMARRRDAGALGVTLLSCDNLPHNGRILEQVVTDFANAVDPSLLAWIVDNVTFPCSMVDRIVPATTDADLQELESVLGVQDKAAVFTEPFCQWVIEENFARGAPDWASAGVILTDDVTPFETIKLRLLNGSHSLMAYLGFLAGYDYVHQVMKDELLQQLVRRYMDQQAQPTLSIPEGFDIEQYKDQLCQRFANSALNHRTCQIAQDGSQKIPQRWLATVGDLTAMGLPTNVLALAVAAWIRYQEGQRDNGEQFTVDDPLAGILSAALSEGLSQGVAPPVTVMGVATVFGDLANKNAGFVQQVSDSYQQLATQGVAQTVAAYVTAPGC